MFDLTSTLEKPSTNQGAGSVAAANQNSSLASANQNTRTSANKTVVSPIKLTGQGGGQVKQTGAVKYTSPVKQRNQGSSPVKEHSQRSSPVKQRSQEGSPVKSVVQNNSPVKTNQNNSLQTRKVSIVTM